LANSGPLMRPRLGVLVEPSITDFGVGAVASSTGCPCHATQSDILGTHLTVRRLAMNRSIWVACLLFLAGPGSAFADTAEEAQKKLQGTWEAAKAERDGKPADDVVGHRLTFAAGRFRIHSKDGKLLYEGTCKVDPSAKPAAIDFEHSEGALKG